MNKEQIIAALAQVYNAAYDEYFRLTELSAQLIREEEEQAHLVIARKATQKSHFMDGVKAAAEALGITETELVKAAADQKGKEGSKC